MSYNFSSFWHTFRTFASLRMIVNNLFIYYLFYLYIISERSNNAAVFQLICCGDLRNYQGFREAKGEVRLRRGDPE